MTQDQRREPRLFNAARGRRSIRLKGYDYARPRAYFVTLVTQQRECLFGEVIAGEMRPYPPSSNGSKP